MACGAMWSVAGRRDSEAAGSALRLRLLGALRSSARGPATMFKRQKRCLLQLAVSGGSVPKEAKLGRPHARRTPDG